MLIGSIFSALVLVVASLVVVAEATAHSKEYDFFSGVGFGFLIDKDLEKEEIEVQTVFLCMRTTYIWKL